MDKNEILETTDDVNLGTELAKTFAISLASTAGAVAGLIAVGAVVGQIQKVKKNRAAKKTQPTEL